MYKLKPLPPLPEVLPIPLCDKNGKKKGTQNLKVMGYHFEEKAWVMENKWISTSIFDDTTYMYLDAGVCSQINKKQKEKLD